MGRKPTGFQNFGVNVDVDSVVTIEVYKTLKFIEPPDDLIGVKTSG
jgi:hypothetical protein